LGIELFGKYGLLFTTVGLVSSLTGLQLGLTAAVHVARYGRTDPVRAAAVMRLCEAVSFGLALICTVAVAAAPATAARLLLGGAEHADVILAGAAIALFSVVAGVQEGVLQGFEQFSKLAIVRMVTSALSFALVYLIAKQADLASTIIALAAGVAIRTVILFGLKEFTIGTLRKPVSFAALWAVRKVLFTFSLPSVLVSLASGLATWYGMFLLAGAPGGFREVAVITASQQWRGVVLYLASMSAAVAVPMMSRLSVAGDVKAVAGIHRVSLWANVGFAVLAVSILGLASGRVLSAYGGDFTGHRLAFWLFVATTVPAIYIQVAQQVLVSHGKMWEQLAYAVFQFTPLALGYYFIVRTHGALGLALWTGVVSVLTCVLLAFRVRPETYVSER
jgi:O-antigen/teichoic acid export membrane protein